jgi:hypothetical protein
MTAISTLHLVFWVSHCLMYIPYVRCQRINWEFACTSGPFCLRSNNIYSYFTWQVKATQVTCVYLNRSVGSVLYVQIVLWSLSGHFGRRESLLPGTELHFSGYSTCSQVTILTTLYHFFNISMDLVVITFVVSCNIYCDWFCNVLFIIF